jgi:tetratricopeptide (TPR) repeat protein
MTGARLFQYMICGTLLLASCPAFAEGAHSARAEALSHQGQALLDSGQVEAACAKFEASNAWQVGLSTLLKLGDCYERAGRNASAWHTFQEASALAQSDKDTESGQRAAARLAALEPNLARITLIIPETSRVPGLSVRLGDNTIPPSSWGAPLPVDAGLQHVSASAKGHLPWAFNFEVAKGSGREYRVNVPTLDPVHDRYASRGHGLRTAGVVTGSVGLAGIGASAVFSALSKSADDAGTCSRGIIQCGRPNTGSAYSEASTISLAVGGALLATGVTLFVLAPSPDKQEKNALRVAARVTGSGGRLQLEGVW